jgi:hypothetical protein
MEITSNNLLDNIIYRANIFNYDTKFLNDVRERNLKLDLNMYSQIRNKSNVVETLRGYQFLKQKSKDQMNQVLSLLTQKDDDEGEELREIEQELGNKKGDKSNLLSRNKDARTTFLLLIDIIMFSKVQITSSENKKLAEGEQMEVEELKSSNLVRNVYSDNILYSLLYLDGLIMFNIDSIKKLDLYCPLLGSTLSEVLFDLINDRFIEDYCKEIASHLLSADLAFTNPEAVNLNIWKDIMNWTFNYYTQK